MYEYRKLTPEERQKLVAERLAKGYPPHKPPHPLPDYDYYLLTATCFEHAHRMNTAVRRQQLLDRVFEVMIPAGIEIRAWVVLPNHYHLLVLLLQFSALPELFRLIHGRLSFIWNGEDKTRGRQNWYRFTDRAIRSERHYQTTLNYIHYNPVKHGVASSPYDWTESSVHWYRENFGRDWLRDMWQTHPVRDYGKGWDNL
ncbi:MAG: transposase [Chloroflexi bacterium]|nr:transposase [Chloroflexota bacterium]